MVERSLLDHQREASAASRTFADELERRRLLREGWSEDCLDSETRFGSRVARLYPLINLSNGVLTSMGPATLVQAFEDRPGKPGAMVMPLRPRTFIWEDGKKRAAAVFIAVEDVKPYRKEK